MHTINLSFCLSPIQAPSHLFSRWTWLVPSFGYCECCNEQWQQKSYLAKEGTTLSTVLIWFFEELPNFSITDTPFYTRTNKVQSSNFSTFSCVFILD